VAVGKPEAAAEERRVTPTSVVVEVVKKQVEPGKLRYEFRNDCRTNH
jgi:hypothetical protein